MFYFLLYYKKKKSNRNHVFEELDRRRDKYTRPASEEILLEVPTACMLLAHTILEHHLDFTHKRPRNKFLRV